MSKGDIKKVGNNVVLVLDDEDDGVDVTGDVTIDGNNVTLFATRSVRGIGALPRFPVGKSRGSVAMVPPPRLRARLLHRLRREDAPRRS